MPSRTLDLGERTDARYAGPVHPRASQPLGAGPERERVGAEMGEAWREEGGGGLRSCRRVGAVAASSDD